MRFFLFLFILVFSLGFYFIFQIFQPVTLEKEVNFGKENKKEKEAESIPAEEKIVQEELGLGGEKFSPPLDRIEERISKKPFGIFINPKNSPVQPERFSGYHTGIDLEIFPEELSAAVAVRTICSGPLLLKRLADGYGGVAVQQCQEDNQPMTVIYGHLDLTSIKKELAQELAMGEILGYLGRDKSFETDNERKHLHLAIHKGLEINLRGYVSNEKDLEGWIDPCQYFCQNSN